jgi:hypothetical protein
VRSTRLGALVTVGTLCLLWAVSPARTAVAQDSLPLPVPSSGSAPSLPPDEPMRPPSSPVAAGLTLQPQEPPTANHRSTLMWGGLYLAASLSALVLFPPDNWHGNITPHPEQMARSWTRAPTWHDGDPWTTNYVGHPIMGSVLYLFARRNFHSPLQAFLFSTLASTTWEYAFEGWYEQPSWSDLLVTSTGGALIGEGRWQIRQLLLRHGTPGALGQVALFLVDPITEIDILFGFSP